MFGRPLGVLLSALFAFSLVTAPSAAASTEVDLAGTVASSNCSGSIVQPSGTPSSAPALVLSNGHCLEDGFPEPGQVIVDQPSERTFTLLSGTGAELGTLRANRLLYATMAGTDVSVYRLGTSYADVKKEHGISPLRLSAKRPAAGTAITVPSGFRKKTYSCSINGFADLREGGYTWHDSIRYAETCQTVGGTSGSPIVDIAREEVVGVNNTGNVDGEQCTMNNPCEVGANGRITVRAGTNYGQQTVQLTRCLTTRGTIELDREGCSLPKP
ncbi:trypsin-like peptidase domain-containing protein [Saccharomonospora sp. NPDC006951]